MTPPIRPTTRTCFALLAAALLLPGCADGGVGPVSLNSLLKIASSAPGGDLAIRSVSKEGAVLKGDFESGIYSLGEKNDLTVLLIDGPADHPRQAVTIRMFWKPRAGSTPIDRTATNATIHYIIFPEAGQSSVGIYSGAGFVYPNSSPGAQTLRAGVWEANLRLADKSPDFTDLLGQAVLKGRFRAQRDDLGIQTAMHTLTVQVRQRLGYPRLVWNDN